jgi:hypothetical protein
MSYWDGIAWTTGGAAATPRRESQATRWGATAVMLLAAGLLILPFGAASAASHNAVGSGCSVNPSSADVGETYLVDAWGLSTRTAINLWVTENGVTAGEPLGGTTTGTFTLARSSTSAGVTTYTFTGPTGKNMKVYARCTVSAY